MAKLTPEAKARLEAIKAVTVKHVHLQAVDEQLSLWVEEHTDATHVLLCGPGGVGKSKALTVVAERFAREEPDRFVVPILLLEPIPPDQGPYLRLDYYWQIIDALKEHLLVKELLGNVAHLMDAPKATRSKLSAIDWLKSLSNRTNVLHVLAGPYALFGFRNTSGQLARRGRDIHFARYHVNDKDERKTFAGAVQYLLERVPLTCDLDAFLKRWRWFAEGSVGCIGILKDWLVDAVAATLVQGETSLTEAVLIRTMPHPAKRVSLEMEARAGEHKVALHNSEGAKQLQALLKKPAPTKNAQGSPAQGSVPRAPQVVQTEQAKDDVPAFFPMPHISPKPIKPRVGQRAPERDPVGTRVQAEKPKKCSFAEEVGLSLVQIQQAGIAKLQCPQCSATWAARIRGNTVFFPPHPKRSTRMTQDIPRWIKQEAGWILYQKGTSSIV